MWWFAVPIVVGVAALIVNELGNEAEEEQSRWRDKREEVEHSLKWHKNNIEKHFEDAKASFDFHNLVDLHYSSTRVADEAYKLLTDAKITLKAIGKALVTARIERDKLTEKLKLENVQSKKKEVKEEIASLVSLRKQLFSQKEEIEEQKENFFIEVKSFNLKTMELKHRIRDDTGYKGSEWYARLEERKRNRA